MKYHVSFFLLFILITSCKQELNDIPDTGRKIVINGIITTDSLLNIRISKSLYINDISGNSGFSFYDLDSADIRLYQNNTYIDSLYHIPYYVFYNGFVFNYGNYKSRSIFPQPGRQYKVIAKSHNLPDASATIVIPDQVGIERVDTSAITLAPGSYITSNVGIMCKIEFNDPANEANYYILNIQEMIGNDYYSPDNTLGFSCDDPIVEEKLFSGIKNEGIAFSDKVINGQKHILNVIIKKEEIGSYTLSDTQTVCFRLYSITEEYFRYIQNLNLYAKNFGNPLADPVMLYSNVSGGYGMVSGAAVSSYSIVFNKN
jgi:hypothetical protein